MKHTNIFSTNNSTTMLLVVLSIVAHSIYIAGAAEANSNPPKLQGYQGQFNFDKSKITLSGFSSGGTFAQMMQFSYSSLFSGIAVFSHTFYRCGPPTGIVDDYDRVCTKLFNLTQAEFYKTDLVHRDIEKYVNAKQIEPVSNLKDKKLYVYAGLSNPLFTVEQSLNILRVYGRYIDNAKSIRTRVQNGNLVLPTNGEKGVHCNEYPGNNAFIGNCGFSGAYEAINFLTNDYGNRRPMIEPQPEQRVNLAPLRQFDQSEFTSGIPNHSMDSVGFIYIPSSGCKNAPCLLHFYFHGCFVGRELNGTTHIENSGFLEVAELNNIILVFPQALSSQPNNRIGCWDTFGLGGPLYATQEGPQIRVVKRILDIFLQNSGQTVSAKNETTKKKNSTRGNRKKGDLSKVTTKY